APDQFEGAIAGKVLERFELLCDRRRETGHVEASPWTEPRNIEESRVGEKAYRGARARKPMPHILGYRKHGLLPGKRLAQDVGEEARGGLVRSSRAYADRRKAQADPVEKTAPAVVGEQQFGDRFLGSVAGQRRIDVVVGNPGREGRAEDGDGRRKHHPRLVGSIEAFGADGLEQLTAAVEIDPVAFVEIGLGLARDD